MGAQWMLNGIESQWSILKTFVEKEPLLNDSITSVQIQEKLSLIPICSNQGERRSEIHVVSFGNRIASS